MKRPIPFDQLVDYVENRLSSAQSAATAVRLATDAEAQKTLTWLQQFSGWQDRVKLPAPSPSVVERLVEQHSAKFAHKQSPSLWQQFVATLSYDSGIATNHAALAGLRSAEVNSSSRQLTFTTPAVDIILDIERSQHQRTIRGQVLPKSGDVSDEFVVQLVHNDSDAGLTHTDDLGEFALETDVRGDIQIVFSNDVMEVWLPPLNLTA